MPNVIEGKQKQQGKQEMVEQKLTDEEFKALGKLKTKFIEPALNYFLELIQMLEKPGYVKFGNDSLFSKYFCCICIYNSALKHITNTKVKNCSKVKQHLTPPHRYGLRHFCDAKC